MRRHLQRFETWSAFEWLLQGEKSGNRVFARLQPILFLSYSCRSKLTGTCAYSKQSTTDTAAELKKSLQFCQQAIERDPNYAPAYFGMADSYALLGWIGYPPTEFMPKAKASLAKALEIDDTLAQAHYSRGIIALYFDFDPSTAKRQFERALELSPNSPEPHYGYGTYLAAVGRLPEAIPQIKHAVDLDPLGLFWNEQLGGVYSGSHQYQRAVEQWQKTLDIATKPSDYR